MKQAKQFKPLRQAGQSIEEEIQRIFDDKIMFYFLATVYFMIAAIIQWIDYLSKTKPDPKIMTVIAAITMGVSFYKIIGYKKRIKHLKQGQLGERQVSEALEWFVRERGYWVFHDIATGKGNIDHVMVSPKGIFTIETKALTPTKKHDGKINFDGQKVIIDGFSSEKNVTQAIAEAHWLKNKLKDQTGKEFRTRAVLLYPGWSWVGGMTQKLANGDIWAFKPENMHLYTDNQPDIINPADIANAVDRIRMLAKTT